MENQIEALTHEIDTLLGSLEIEKAEHRRSELNTQIDTLQSSILKISESQKQHTDNNTGGIVEHNKKDDNPDNITTNADNKDKDIETSQKDTDNKITENVKDKENDEGIIANEKDNVENKQLRRTDRTHRMTERARQNQEQVKLKRFWHLYSEGNSNIADVKKELAKSTSDCRFETFIDVLEDSHDKIRDTYEELK